MCYDTSNPKGVICVDYDKVKVAILEITAKYVNKKTWSVSNLIITVFSPLIFNLIELIELQLNHNYCE